jgi:hypothetical protein
MVGYRGIAWPISRDHEEWLTAITSQNRHISVVARQRRLK